MDARRNRDRLSSLPDFLLVQILSNLPFKEALRTSVLASRWKDLHRESTNISFKESEYVKRSVSKNGETGRASFVGYMVQWVSKFSGEDIETFELSLFNPVGFETEIKYLIEFAVSKKVKNLVLDFSDPSWNTSDDDEAEVEGVASVFQLPECVYSEASFESLKLFACGFEPSRFAQQGSLKSLCFGWTQLRKIMALLWKSPLLESLIIQNCWDVGLEAITDSNDRLRELIFENCDFATEYSTLDLPNIQIVKYSGEVHYFQFMRVNRMMEEAYLEFDEETEHDAATATILCGLLYDLSSARKLTVCHVLIQAIKDSEDPVRLAAPMETNHLVIRSNVTADDFVGIRFMLNSCPDLHTLTFEIVPPGPDSTTAPGFDPETYWSYGISHECLKKTLKVVEVRNFYGGTYVFHVLKYLVRWGLVMERVDFYLPSGVDANHKAWARYALKKLRKEFEASSDLLRVYLHNG